MSKSLSKARRLGKRGTLKPAKLGPLQPAKETQLPFAEMLRLVSELHLNSLTLAGPPRLPIASVPGGLGQQLKLPRHASEMRAIEGYHCASHLASSSSVSINSFSFSKTPSPVPARKVNGNQPIRRSYQSYRGRQGAAFLTETAEKQQHPRSISVRSTYTFSETPVPTNSTQPSAPVVTSYNGDYYQGLRHGEGEATFSNGDVYRGAWAEGFRYGYGEFRYSAPAVSFRGDWVDDLKHGSGLVQFANGDCAECLWKRDFISDKTAVITYARAEARYEGEIMKAAKHGDGTLTFRDGSRYRGQWMNDRRHGQGLLTLPDGLYEGCFSHDAASGPGLLYIRQALFLRAGTSASLPVAALPAEKERLLGDIADFYNFAYSAIVGAGDIVWRTVKLAELQLRIGEVEGGSDGCFVSGVLNGAAVVLYGAFGLYEGTVKEGKRSGYGRMTYTNSKSQCLNFPESEGVYLGRWRNDERHGRGQMKWPNGLTYEGEFVRDRRHGVKGTLLHPSGERYDGDWKHDLMHGAGRYADGKGTTFVGEFVSGHPVRRGQLLCADGSEYTGEVVDMKPCGEGVLSFANSDRYEGQFQNGLRHGKGVMEYANGARYEGEWRMGVREGSGAFTFAGERYDGLWLADKQHGTGLLTTAENETFAGTWNQGRAEGRMTVVNRKDA